MSKELKQMQAKLDTLEAILNQILMLLPKPTIELTEEEIWKNGEAAGKSPSEILKEINAWKEELEAQAA